MLAGHSLKLDPTPLYRPTGMYPCAQGLWTSFIKMYFIVEGGTFEGQFVRWSVKTVREVPSFLSLKRRGGQLLPQSSSLSQQVTYLPMTPFKLCR